METLELAQFSNADIQIEEKNENYCISFNLRRFNGSICDFWFKNINREGHNNMHYLSEPLRD